MLIAHFVQQDSLRISRVSAIALIVVGFGVLLTGFPVNGLAPGTLPRTVLGNVLPSAAVIVGAICLERNGWMGQHPWLHWLGDASYSIYLTHIFSLGVARFVWARMGLDSGGLGLAVAFALFGMICVIGGAWLTYNSVEKPTLSALQRLLKTRRPAVAKPTIARETLRSPQSVENRTVS